LVRIREYFRGTINLGLKKLVENCLYMEAFIASLSPSPPSLNKRNVKDSELLIGHNVGDNQCRVPIFLSLSVSRQDITFLFAKPTDSIAFLQQITVCRRFYLHAFLSLSMDRILV